MSVPAHELTPALPRRTIGAPPRRRPVAAPSPERPAVTAPRARTERRARRFHPAFWALTAAIVTTMVVALVSVSALVVETGFGIDRTEQRIASLLEEGERLRMDVAAMSAPGRIARWAARRGLVMPEEVIVLQVPDRSAAAAAGGSG